MHLVSIATPLRQSGPIAAVICVLLFAGPIFGQTKASGRNDVNDAKNANPADIVKRLLEVNSVWLDPRPSRLSYTLTGSLKMRDLTSKTANRVWIDGDKMRWEMEDDAPASPETQKKLAYTLICRGGEEAYTRAPSDRMLKQRRPARDRRSLKQGITWSTAIHSLRQHGLPAGCRIVETKATDQGQIVVLLLEMKGRSEVGLGLDHVYFGRVRMPLGQVRLHIRLPDYVPLLEEFLDRDVRIEYDPKFLVFGERRAPAAIKYVGKSVHIGRWELEAHFQEIKGVWLLDRALNRADGKTVAELILSNVSTAAIDPKLFEFPSGK
jgi:hypothetical protein